MGRWMMQIVAKVFWVCVGIGVFLGVMTLFGNNPFHFFSWVFDWIVWFIDSVANMFSHNQTTQEILSARPTSLAG